MWWVEQRKTLPLLEKLLGSLHMHAQEHVFQRIGAVAAHPRPEVSHKLCWGIYIAARGLKYSFKREITLVPTAYILLQCLQHRGAVHVCFLQTSTLKHQFKEHLSFPGFLVPPKLGLSIDLWFGLHRTSVFSSRLPSMSVARTMKYTQFFYLEWRVPLILLSEEFNKLAFLTCQAGFQLSVTQHLLGCSPSMLLAFACSSSS